MTFAQMNWITIFYIGLCCGLLLFALILIIALTEGFWADCQEKLVLAVKWFFHKDQWILWLVLVSGGTLLTLGPLFPEPPRPVLPEPPEIGRYLLADDLDRIAEFNSQANCQFAKNSIWVSYEAGKNLGQRLICIYLGKGEAKP